MKVMEMKIIFRKLLLVLWSKLVYCSISGVSYMDSIKMNSIKSVPPGEDPCNPLYWYPRNIPEFCNFDNTARPVSSEEPPIAHTSPPAVPPVLVPMMPPPVPILPQPIPMLPHPSLIAGVSPLPLFPAPPSAPLISIPSNPYPYSHINPISAFSPHLLPYHPSFQRPPTGFVPGMHGLVTKDGGINIMPFSDAYADMLEKHKNKVIRRKLHKILDKYEHYPYSRNYRNLRKYEKYFTDD
ncbi:proline-rich extensin-like protein EPR1 [Maniola jurtina]|uniref:proline-rich extensin-like protein EPR1 n=1 Tax=Maniola jurtina TaxID=191418 RepID=UPI001E6872CB|nr:proline-rich extensin-like protein EPR1 [Maniola jurtina]